MMMQVREEGGGDGEGRERRGEGRRGMGRGREGGREGGDGEREKRERRGREEGRNVEREGDGEKERGEGGRGIGLISALCDHSTTGLVGFVNIGNSCYMNATLQALSNWSVHTDNNSLVTE